MENKIFTSGNIYNLFYQDKDYNSESLYIHKVLSQNNIPGNKILELGCGTGKHAKILAEIGYEVLGIDQSKSMIANAIITEGFTCKIGDIRNFKADIKFDAVISLFHVLSYQISNKSLNEVFQNAFFHLNKNGIFLFDVWYAPAVFYQKPLTRVKKVCQNNHTITRIAEPEFLLENNQVNIKYSFFEFDNASNAFNNFEEIHSMRYFTIPEVEYIANSNGFKILKVEELVSENHPSLDTWGVCFALKKYE